MHWGAPFVGSPCNEDFSTLGSRLGSRFMEPHPGWLSMQLASLLEFDNVTAGFSFMRDHPRGKTRAPNLQRHPYKSREQPNLEPGNIL